MKRSAVVILNWNGRKLLEQFLPVLLQCTSAEDTDIIVADNGSTDDSLDFLEKHAQNVHCIALEKNYGYAEGYNKALFDLDYEYVAILNSDVEVTPGWLKTVTDYLDANPNVTAVQPKILDYKNKLFFEYAGACGGFLDMYGYPFCRGRIFETIEKDSGQYDSPTPVLWGSGACLIIRLGEYKEMGGFDSRFFAHQEEIDLCWRLNARGKQIMCLPQSTVYHIGGATLKMEHPQKTFLNFRNNLLMLYKNLPEKRYFQVMFIRFFLDYLTVLRFLLKAAPANAFSIMKARRDFHRKKKDYKEIRKENREKSIVELPSGLMKKSLLWNYYFKNKKKYSDLNK